MKIFRNILLALPLMYFTSCRDCSSVSDSGNPDQLVRFFDAEGDNLWFGDSAEYDPEDAVFIHDLEGELMAEPVAGHKAIRLKFPVAEDALGNITLQVDSTTSYDIEYKSLIYNNDCVKVYELSFVKFEGKQVCGVCGSTQFNDDRYINLRLQ